MHEETYYFCILGVLEKITRYSNLSDIVTNYSIKKCFQKTCEYITYNLSGFSSICILKKLQIHTLDFDDWNFTYYYPSIRFTISVPNVKKTEKIVSVTLHVKTNISLEVIWEDKLG